VYKEKQRPRPPRVGREFVRRQLVCEKIDAADEQPEDRPGRDADEPDQDIRPRILRLVGINATLLRIIRLQPDQQGKYRNGNDRRRQKHRTILFLSVRKLKQIRW